MFSFRRAFFLCLNAFALTLGFGGLAAQAQTAAVESAIATLYPSQDTQGLQNSVAPSNPASSTRASTPTATEPIDASSSTQPNSATALGTTPIEIGISPSQQANAIPLDDSTSNFDLDTAQLSQNTSDDSGSGGKEAETLAPDLSLAAPVNSSSSESNSNSEAIGSNPFDQFLPADDAELYAQQTPSDTTVPESTTPSETAPSDPAPYTTPDTPTSPPEQAAPDRTPPGIFTPDTTNVSPGRATRSGPSYVGIGGNIGLGTGDTALGEGSLYLFSKIGLTSNISVRPALLISDNLTILLPVTLDFFPAVTGATADASRNTGFRISPYLGIGPAISTGDDTSVNLLLTDGVDIPIARRFTGNIAVNATVIDRAAVGLAIGVGYNF